MMWMWMLQGSDVVWMSLLTSCCLEWPPGGGALPQEVKGPLAWAPGGLGGTASPIVYIYNITYINITVSLSKQQSGIFMHVFQLQWSKGC